MIVKLDIKNTIQRNKNAELHPPLFHIKCRQDVLHRTCVDQMTAHIEYNVNSNKHCEIKVV